MTLRIVDAVVLGRHGVVPVRHYEPDAAAPASQQTVVWLHGGGFTHGDLVLGGASAGACLAAAATLRLLSEGSPGPARLLCVYGIFHAALPPYTAEQRARLRGRHGLLQYRPGMIKLMSRNYVGRSAITDPFAFPGGHDLHRMPPTLVLDADRDSLRASGERFAAELAAAGSQVGYQVVPDARHGFLNRPTTAPFADGIARILRWLEQRVP